MDTITHPFPPYIGLGLLDELSIGFDDEDEEMPWSAEYPIGTERYLEVAILKDGVEIEEFDETGRRVATTFGASLNEAIALHGQGGVDGRISRIWLRAARGAPGVWTEVSTSDTRISFAPAIALGRLCVPAPLDGAWVRPEPGPLARQLGFAPFSDPDSPAEATLVRFFDGAPIARAEPIWLHWATIPVILLAETVGAIYAANGPLRSIEWRPFVNPEPVRWTTQRWDAFSPIRLPDGGILTGFSLERVVHPSAR